MKWMAMIAVVAGLAGCGVDGPPQRPVAKTTTQKPGVSISGHATIGVITEL